jgi:hypothetical protein
MKHPTRFVVRLADVAKWLDVEERNLKNPLLRQIATEGRDFRVGRGRSTGGRPKEDVLLTKDCLHRLIALSCTAKAKEVRAAGLSVDQMCQALGGEISLSRMVVAVTRRRRVLPPPTGRSRRGRLRDESSQKERERELSGKRRASVNACTTNNNVS